MALTIRNVPSGTTGIRSEPWRKAMSSTWAAPVTNVSIRSIMSCPDLLDPLFAVTHEAAFGERSFGFIEATGFSKCCQQSLNRNAVDSSLFKVSLKNKLRSGLFRTLSFQKP